MIGWVTTREDRTVVRIVPGRRARWRWLAAISAIVVVVLVAACGIVRAVPEFTGSQVLMLERSDVGDVYAAASIVLEAAIAPAVSAVLIHDQAVTWEPGFSLVADRYAEWDVSLAWRPVSGWSVSLGRRWRVGPPPDYGGPWTYVQVWRGM